jgi:hypothetical protein
MIVGGAAVELKLAQENQRDSEELLFQCVFDRHGSHTKLLRTEAEFPY